MTQPISNRDLSAYLDGEISPAERLLVEMNLAKDSQLRASLDGLRELDSLLRSELIPPRLDVEHLLSQMARPENEVKEQRFELGTKRQHRSMFYFGLASALAVSLLLTLGNWERLLQRGTQSETLPSSIAEIVRSFGSIEFRTQPGGPWEVWTSATLVPLEAGVSIRTPSDSLCEIITQQAGTLRLNRGTELVLHRPDEVELRRGELWCETGDSPLIVRGTKRLEATRNDSNQVQFTCPQNVRVQCRIESDVLRLGCVSETPLTVLLSGQQELAISPGEWVACSFSVPQTVTGQFDQVDETAWQLPLLMQRSAGDSELHDFLFVLLARLGQSKMQYLYEERIRELGPPGALPLIAFVQSEKSRTNPETRQRAMRIVADLAPESTRPDLTRLSYDSDAVVAGYANQAIARLDQDIPKQKM